MDLDKYVGIEYKFDVTDDSKCVNCLTLIRRFYKDNNFSETFDDGKKLPHTAIEEYKTRLLLYLIKNFDKKYSIDKLEYGDIVLLKTNNDINIGTYVGNGKVLTIEIPTVQGKSKSTIYEKHIWEPLVKAVFKRKNKS